MEPPAGSAHFEGDLEKLLDRNAVVVAEIYPRMAYALALSADEPATRAPMQFAKTRPDIREAALADLQSRPWVLEPKTFDAYMDVKLFLERRLGRSVDLVLADAVKPRLRPTILAEAVHAAGL